MPTCASKIMLTSLAPSPTARVMGCSLEALISLTICGNPNKSLQSAPTVVYLQSCLFSHLSFLQRRHATAENSATVAADLEEDLSVVPVDGSLLLRFQNRRQRGAVNDQTKVKAVDRQPGRTVHRPVHQELLTDGTGGDLWCLSLTYPEMERCLSTVLLSSNRTSCRLCSSVRFLVSSRICVLRRNSLLA